MVIAADSPFVVETVRPPLRNAGASVIGKIDGRFAHEDGLTRADARPAWGLTVGAA